MNALNVDTSHLYYILAVAFIYPMKSMFVRYVKPYKVLYVIYIVAIEYLEETVLLPNITNNIEIEEKFCNHHSCQELSSIHYNIKSTFSSLDNSIPHFRFYHTAKDIEQVNSRGCRYFVRCNDCNKEIEFDVFEDRLTNKCALCGNINLEKWDEPYCPKCGEKMIFGIGDEGFCFGEWD